MERVVVHHEDDVLVLDRLDAQLQVRVARRERLPAQARLLGRAPVGEEVGRAERRPRAFDLRGDAQRHLLEPRRVQDRVRERLARQAADAPARALDDVKRCGLHGGKFEILPDLPLRGASCRMTCDDGRLFAGW